MDDISDDTDHDNFNSIKVRLKHLKNEERRKICIFQFHKGTIKTLWQQA